MDERWSNGREHYRFATVKDLADFAEMLSDPEVGRWLWFTPAPREMYEQFFAPLVEAQAVQIAAGMTPSKAVFTIQDELGVFLGQGAAIEVEGSPGGFELGFQLCREAWGRGVGTRVGEFLRAYAVHCCNAYRLEGTCLEGNAASRAILEHLGLQIEGRRPGYRLREGARYTELCYGVEVSALDAAAIRTSAGELGLLES